MRHPIPDEIWTVRGPMVESRRSKLGLEPEPPNRMFFEAVLYWARTGIPWRDLPAEFGAWDPVYNGLRRWIHSGRLVFECLANQSPALPFGDVERHDAVLVAGAGAGDHPRREAAARAGQSGQAPNLGRLSSLRPFQDHADTHAFPV